MRRSVLFSALLLAAAVLFAFPARGETTNFLFCATSDNEAAAAANQAASGWTFSSPGSPTQAKADSYYYPVKFNSGTSATSASVVDGFHMTELVLGVKVSNVARTVTVTPYDASGSSGTPQTIAPGKSGSLVDVSFSFTAAAAVSYVTIKIAGSGNATAYLYYATVTTEAAGGGGGNHAPAATQPSVDVDATVGTAAEVDLSDYFTDADGDPLTYALDTGVGAVSGSIWSFTPNAAGSFSAEVSATDPSGASATMALSVTATDSSGLLRATLLDEGFSGADNAWSNPSAKPGDAETDCDSWTFPAFVYNARSAIKLGKTDAAAWALSPEITLSNEVTSANIVLSFSAATFPTKTTKFSVSVVDVDTGATNAISSLASLSPTALDDDKATVWSGGTDYSETITVPTHFKLLFETLSTASDKRLLLDSIQVTQVYDPNFAALAAPTGVAGSDIGKHGFTVSWTGVANATGYEVWLNGAVAGSCASTSTSMELSGLSDGTTYSVQVKALGDNLHFGDSPLSTAISVTTPADAQKIGFTVTGAPAGDVFAGDTVAFTVTAENEATHAAAEVSFSGIAGATFDAGSGAFSWTTAESDVGSHTATFTSGDYSTNVTLSVVSALKTETLFHETFAKCEKKWIGTSTEMTDAMADEANWTFSEHCYSGKSGLRIGLKEAPNYGLAMTRLIEPKKAGTISLSFRAAGNVAGSTMTVTSAGGATFSQTVTLAAFSSDDAPIPDEAGYVFGPYDIVVTGGFSLSFTPASGDGRMGVDEILVTQKISARIPDLPAPTGLALAGEPGETGFSVAWNAVTGATNYAVRVTDASGVVVFSAPFCAAAQATVTGLADDEAYAVQVRATGDEALWFASPWSAAVNIRTARSAAHATLSFGPWINAAGDGLLYAGITNAAAASAVRDNGTNAVVTFTGVSPEPTVGPEFENGILAWTPDDADTNKTFIVSFLLDGTYATNLSFKVRSVPFLQAPKAEAVDVAWNSFGLSWNRQLRAAGYAVRAWTDCPNPNATATRIEEDFAGYAAGVRPADWVFHCATGSSGFYKDDKAPVKLSESTHDLETYDLGGAISSVSFHAAGHSIAGSTSELTVVGIAADETETVLATLTAEDIGQTDAGIDRTYSVPAGVRRIAWRYTKDKGGIGVGSVVIEGTGFATPRWLPGWGPAAKDVGLAQVCTVKKPRPGKALGPNPANKKEDLFEPRVNYAEVAARDAAGATRATVVAVEVPAPPRSVRATMLIAR